MDDEYLGVGDALEISNSLFDDIICDFLNSISVESVKAEIYNFLLKLEFEKPIQNRKVAFVLTSESVFLEIWQLLGTPNISVDGKDLLLFATSAWRDLFGKSAIATATFNVGMQRILNRNIPTPVVNIQESKSMIIMPKHTKNIGGRRRPSFVQNPKNTSIVHTQYFEIIKGLDKSSALWDLHGFSSGQSLAEFMTSSLKLFQPAGIKTKLNFWFDFRAYCSEVDVDVFNPGNEGFIKIWGIKREKSFMTGYNFCLLLGWLRSYIGVKYEKSVILSNAIKSSQLQFARKRGKAPLPWISDLVHLEKLACDFNTPEHIKFIAACGCLCTWATLRIIDLQRLKFIHFNLEDNYAIAELSYQKNPRPGEVKPPVEVIVNLEGIIEDHWWEVIYNRWKKNPDDGFVVRDMVFERNNFIGGGCDILSSKASPSSIRKWLNLCFTWPSTANRFDNDRVCPIEEALRGHSWRFVLPTAGDILDIPEDRATLLGRWTKGRNKDGTMCKRYSAARSKVNLITIRSILQCFRIIVGTHGMFASFDHLDPRDVSFVAIKSKKSKRNMELPPSLLSVASGSQVSGLGGNNTHTHTPGLFDNMSPRKTPGLFDTVIPTEDGDDDGVSIRSGPNFYSGLYNNADNNTSSPRDIVVRDNVQCSSSSCIDSALLDPSFEVGSSEASSSLDGYSSESSYAPSEEISD